MTIAACGQLLRANKAIRVGDIYLRPGTADIHVYDEVFVHREYDIYVEEPRFIVDAGAHIGIASVFFASRFPKATIVALEPESSNFELLEKNCANFRNVYPIKAGLWTHKTHLRIENPHADTWSFRVVEAEDGIPALSMLDLMEAFGFSRIDIAKIDIEGAEREVLLDASRWIGKVSTMIIELHDRYRPGCEHALAEAIRGRPFRRSMSGESVVLRAV